MNVHGGTTLEADVCIIGGGAAGLTVAQTLSERGWSVLILERGVRHAGAAEHADNRRFEDVGIPIGPAEEVRRFGLGGSGRMWGHTLVELAASDFARTAGTPGWPFDLAHLRPYYDRARALMQAEPATVPAQAVSDDLAMVPAWRSPLTFPLPREPAARLRLAARVVRIVAERGAVRRLEAVSLRRPFTAFTVHAARFVLAAGAIENAALLLHSGLGGEMTGRFFSDHPQMLIPIGLRRSQLAAVVPPSLFHPPGAAWALTDSARSRDGLPGASGYFVTHRDPAVWSKPNVVATGTMVHALLHRDLPPRPLSGLARMVAGTPDLVRAARSRSGDPHQALRVTMGTIPTPDSRVTLSTTSYSMGVPVPRVDWRFGPESLRAVDRLVAAVARLAAHQGWGPLVVPPDLGPITPGAHHMGTTRMAENPTDGVVDPDCQVHGISNLSVAGASVFPTYGWANPMLTVLALALRLGDDLTT